MFGTSFYGDKRKTRTIDLGLKGEMQLAEVRTYLSQLSGTERYQLGVSSYSVPTVTDVIRAALAMLHAKVKPPPPPPAKPAGKPKKARS